MSLDPQITDLLERIRRANRPPFWQMSAQEARASYAKGAPILELPQIKLHAVNDYPVATEDGATIKVRRYQALPSADHLPMLIYCHGGGFTVGSIETHDRICRMFARDAGCIVLSVDYRLAPEHKFPIAVDDAWAAVSWARQHAVELGADPHRIALAGDSAGGTLTAVNTIRARDAGWSPVLQLLIYPGTCARQNTPSHQRLKEGYMLDEATIQWFFSQYLPDDAARLDWRFAPLDGVPAPSLQGVAPACILVAGYDPLHDEGVDYAERLREAGVAAKILDYPGMVHGFFNFGGYIGVARDAHRDSVLALRNAFGLEQ